MTDVAPKDDSATNLSAFNLGVFANQLLWNLDQSVLVGSERHRIAALGLIRRLQALGAEFIEMKTDAPLQVVLNEIREQLPDNVSQSYGEWLDNTLSRGMEQSDGRSEGEWWYGHFGLDQKRKRLWHVIVDATLQTAEQRLWFELGELIDSGRHRPDTGYHVYRFNPWLVSPLPATTNPQPIETRNDGPDSHLPTGDTPAAEPSPSLRTFDPGELPPRPEWWQEMVHLCEGLHVPCNSEQPDFSTTTSIIDTVEQLIESVRACLTASPSEANVPAAVGSAAPTGSGDGHQQSMPCPPTDETEQQETGEPPPLSDRTSTLSRNSTQQGGEDMGTQPPLADTAALVTPGDAIPPASRTPQNTVEMPDENGSTQTAEGRSGSKGGDVRPAEKTEKFGDWEFWPAQVRFKDEAKVDLINLPREIFKRLLSTTNPDGWVIWTALASDSWEKDSDPNRQAVIAGVYRLNEELLSLAKKLGSTKLIESKGKLNALSYRVDPSVK